MSLRRSQVILGATPSQAAADNAAVAEGGKSLKVYRASDLNSPLTSCKR